MAPTATRARNVSLRLGLPVSCSPPGRGCNTSSRPGLAGPGLPHAEAHAIILPHVTRFNLAAAPEAQARLVEALGGDPADRLALMLRGFPIPQRLAEIGFDRAKVDFVGGGGGGGGGYAARRGGRPG